MNTAFYSKQSPYIFETSETNLTKRLIHKSKWSIAPCSPILLFTRSGSVEWKLKRRAEVALLFCLFRFFFEACLLLFYLLCFAFCSFCVLLFGLPHFVLLSRSRGLNLHLSLFRALCNSKSLERYFFRSLTRLRYICPG